MLTSSKDDIFKLNINNHPDYSIEVEHLDNTILEMKNEINELKEENDIRCKTQKELFKENNAESSRDVYISSYIHKSSSEKIKEIESIIGNPYFGRIDLKSNGSRDLESLYIGKVGFKQDTKYGVIDWRMPIASVFYECENGKAEYESPTGQIFVNVERKRQYTISDGKLFSFTDDVLADKIVKITDSDNFIKDDDKEEIVITDQILLDKLAQNSDKRLNDIVETIRSEQNKIIRQPLNRILVVQGVAGSGKSTVGLHRISYILYNNESIDPSKVLIIAPNLVFLDYISELLPGLDVNGITQFTFEQTAIKILRCDIKVAKDEKIEFFTSSSQENLYMFLRDALTDVSRFKGSLSFIKLIQYIINKKTNEIVENIKDVRLFAGKLVINKDEQLRYFSANAPLNKKIGILRTCLISF